MKDSNSSSSFYTPAGASSSRVTRPDFLDLSSSLVKKQRFMFTPPTEQPPSSFEEVRQSGDGSPAPGVDPNESEISEYHTPTKALNSTGDSSVHSDWAPGSLCENVDEVDGAGDDDGDDPFSQLNDSHDTTMNDDFVSFHESPSMMERCAPQGLSDHELNGKFSLPLNSTANDNGKEGLFKWKGVILTPDEELREEANLGLVCFTVQFWSM